MSVSVRIGVKRPGLVLDSATRVVEILTQMVSDIERMAEDMWVEPEWGSLNITTTVDSIESYSFLYVPPIYTHEFEMEVFTK